MTESCPVRKGCLVDILRFVLEAVDPYRVVARHEDEMLIRVMFSVWENERHVESERGEYI
jgi:hypothetical protein